LSDVPLRLPYRPTARDELLRVRLATLSAKGAQVTFTGTNTVGSETPLVRRGAIAGWPRERARDLPFVVWVLAPISFKIRLDSLSEQGSHLAKIPEGTRMRDIAGLALITACLGGCAASRIVDQPSNITLEMALRETVAALHSIQDQGVYNGSNSAVGFNPCTMQVTFAITAGATDNKSLVLNLGAPTGAPITAGLQGTIGTTETTSRGNTVTLLFATPACNPTGTLGSARPDEVSLLQQQIGAARLNQYMKPLGPVVAVPSGGGAGH
jgi:hypothetical protein